MNQTTITKQRGLSDFALKYFAMVCMILDHIHYFSLIYREDPTVLFVDRQACRPAVPLLYRGGFSSHARPEKIFSAYLRHRHFMGLVQFSLL